MSELTKQKYKRLVERLYEKTRDKGISWSQDLVEESVVNTVIGNRTLEVSGARNARAEPIVRVTLRDAEGRVLDVFDDDDLKDFETPYVGFDNYWKLMSELHQLAVRQTTGADDALDDLLQALDKDEPF